MTPRLKRLSSAFALSLVMAGALVGCHKREGPAQEAGKALDQGAASAGQAIQNAGQSIQNTAKGNP